jgi:uncharacterized protein (TIGR03000 family)
MNTSLRLLAVGLLSCSALLLLSGSSEAQMRGYRGRVVNRPVHPPGWDWWRIYPWSPYNYGRNPYNPIVYPDYPPYYPPYNPPYYPPYSYSDYQPPVYDPPVYGAVDSQQPVLVPHPSGRVATPPPDAAVIRLYIPDKFGDVWFDGVETESVGTTRYYVTPELPRDKALKYVVKASFKRDGVQVIKEQTVSVSPGKTAVVDFR